MSYNDTSRIRFDYPMLSIVFLYTHIEHSRQLSTLVCVFRVRHIFDYMICFYKLLDYRLLITIYYKPNLLLCVI